MKQDSYISESFISLQKTYYLKYVSDVNYWSVQKKAHFKDTYVDARNF